MSQHTITFTVNGEAHALSVPANRLLADCLRDDLHLTGTKRGCETGVCGACSVLIDGVVVKSCLSLTIHAQNRVITTVEGLAKDGALHPLQEAFLSCGGLQCGFCTPGFLMAAADLLARNPDPTPDEVRHALNGNLCRCTGYTQIVESILRAAENMRGH
jgi:aerobic carbon-monoxide dehydrogenase small subunit